MLFGCESFEFEIMKYVHNLLQNDFMDFFMTAISVIGNGGAVWIVLTLILLSIKKYRRLGLKMTVGLIAGLILGNIVLKNLIARPRPCWIFDNIDMLIAIPKDFSFPSGHTLASFTSAFILLAEHKRMGVPALIVAILMAFSRMYLFVHFPTDIIGGVILSGIICVVVKIFIKEKNATA